MAREQRHFSCLIRWSRPSSLIQLFHFSHSTQLLTGPDGAHYLIQLQNDSDFHIILISNSESSYTGLGSGENAGSQRCTIINKAIMKFLD